MTKHNEQSSLLRFSGAFFLLLFLLLTLLSCGPGRERTVDGVARLEVWQGFNAEETDIFREIMLEFEQDYEQRTGRKIMVDLQYVAFNDMPTKLRTAALARMTPDIAFMDSVKVTDLGMGNALTPIEELSVFKERYGSIEQGREEFVGASYDANVVNRLGTTHLYGIPVQTTTIALFWNREIFRSNAGALREANLDPNRAPRDWDELLAYGKVLTDSARGRHGFAMSRSLWFNFPFFNMYEVDFVHYDDEGVATPAMNTPNGEAALARIQQLANSGVEGGAWSIGGLGPEQGFLNNRYAMIMTGPWNVENFTNAGLDFDISLIPAPSWDEIRALNLRPAEDMDPENITSYSSSNLGGQSGVIMRLCEDKELAFEVLDYFTSEKVQRRWAEQLSQIPVRRSAWDGLDTSKFPYMPIFMRQLSTSRPLPRIPLFDAMENDVFNPQIDLLLTSRRTPEQMLQSMEEGIDRRILNKMNTALKSAKEASGE